MSEPLQPTPYPAVNAVLRDFLGQVQAILGEQFVGMYLSGSLALGDFDPHGSDIDFVVVTAAMLSDERITALREMHARFDAGGSPWAARVEAVYVPQAVLRHGAPPGAHYPQIEKDRPFFLDALESGWIYHCYILREHGVTLAGPAPQTLIAPVDPDAMRRAAAPIAALWLEQARTDPGWLEWLREPGSQAFVALTLCRLLYTLETGGVASKPAAARWAQRALEPRWAGLIERALAGQHDPAPPPEQDVTATVALVQYTVDRFRQWDTPAPQLFRPE
jgi:hypothetical protein